MVKINQSINLNIQNLPNPFPGTAKNYTFSKAHTNGTLISVILDESGSMAAATDATIAGFNEFVQGQQAATDAGRAYLTVTKFDAPFIKTLYTNVPIEQVLPLTREDYRPNGGTNLMDAVGQAINSVEKVISAVPEQERPGVIIVIMTDGYENASREFNSSTIKSMVAAAEAADWTFLFLGANIDAFEAGSHLGMSAMNTVNYSTADMRGTMTSVSASTTAMRGAKIKGMSTAELYTSGTTTSGFAKE